MQSARENFEASPLRQNRMPYSYVFASSQSLFTAATDLWISNFAKVSKSTFTHDSTSQYFCQGRVLLAKNHCLTTPDKHIQCVVLGAQGGSSKLPEPPLDPPLYPVQAMQTHYSAFPQLCRSRALSAQPQYRTLSVYISTLLFCTGCAQSK